MERIIEIADGYGLPRVLNVEDITTHPDEKAVLLFLSGLKNYYEDTEITKNKPKKAEGNDLTKRIKELEEEVEELKSESLKEENEKLKVDLKETFTTVHRLEEDLSDLHNTSNNKDKEISDLREQVTRLEEALTNKKGDADDVAKLKTDLIELSSQHDILQKEHDNCGSIMNKLEVRVSHQEEEITSQEEEIKELKSIIKEKSRENAAAEQRLKSLEKVEEENETLKTKNATLQDRQKLMDDEIKRLEAQLNSDNSSEKLKELLTTLDEKVGEIEEKEYTFKGLMLIVVLSLAHWSVN